MKKIIFIITCFSIISSAFANNSISQEVALQLVKNQYANTDNYLFYITSVDSIYDDGDDSCIFDSIPQQDWLTSNSTPKWLIFVDEDPMKGWSHPCSYFYIPKRFEHNSVNDIPSVKFNGRKYPRHITMNIVNTVSNENLNSLYEPFLINRDDYWDDYFLYTDVLFLGGGYNRDSNHWRFWNDCNYLYETLQNEFNIHPITMYSCYAGNAGRLYGDNIITNNSGIFSTVPYYFGTKHNSFTKEGIFEMFEYLSSEVEMFNFVVFVSCHGDIDSTSLNPYLDLWDIADDGITKLYGNNIRLYATELDSLISSIKTQNITIILQNCHSGAFIETLSKPGRVIITACSPNEESSSYLSNDTDAYFYNVFSNLFTHALHGEDLFGNIVNADNDNNGRVTLAEAYNYANEQDTIPTEHPMYYSNPSWLGEEFSFDVLPDTTNLFVRDNFQDEGSNIHAASGVFWNSPDIWVRTQDDGFTVKENDHLLLGNDEKLYVYVRVNNRGYRDYVDPSKYLHLYWKTNTLKMGRNDIYDTGSPFGGKITTLSLDAAIATDTSCIYRYVWQLPTTLVSRAAANGNILDIEVLALVNDTTTAVVPEDSDGMIAMRENSYVAIRKESTIKPSLGKLVNIPPFDYLRRVKIPIYISPSVGNTASKITLQLDSASTGNLFTYCNLYLELSPSIYASSSNLPKYNITTTNSSPRKYKLNGNGSSFNLIVPQGGIDSLVFYCDYSQLQPTNDINSLLHLKLTNASDSLLDAETYRIFISGNSGGGTGGPGIITSTGNDGSCQLTATGIEEPSQLEWYSPQQVLMSEGETLQLTTSRQQGVYTLRVASELTGAVSYATTTIADEPVIESVTPNPFNNQFTVRLAHPATTSSIIRLTAINGTGRIIEVPISTGELEVDINATDCTSGIYAVGLYENGTLTDNRRIIKQ